MADQLVRHFVLSNKYYYRLSSFRILRSAPAPMCQKQLKMIDAAWTDLMQNIHNNCQPELLVRTEPTRVTIAIDGHDMLHIIDLKNHAPSSWYARMIVHFYNNTIKTLFFDIPASHYIFDNYLGMQGIVNKYYNYVMVNFRPSCNTSANKLLGRLKLNEAEKYQND
jgi:hypothetical protein